MCLKLWLEIDRQALSLNHRLVTKVLFMTPLCKATSLNSHTCGCRYESVRGGHECCVRQ